MPPRIADMLEIPLDSRSPSILVKPKKMTQFGGSTEASKATTNLTKRHPQLQVKFDLTRHEEETYSSVDYERGMYLRRPTPQELIEIRKELHVLFGRSQYLAGKTPGGRSELDEWSLLLIAIVAVLLLAFQERIESYFW